MNKSEPSRPNNKENIMQNNKTNTQLMQSFKFFFIYEADEAVKTLGSTMSCLTRINSKPW
jgi:hypothetical protein